MGFLGVGCGCCGRVVLRVAVEKESALSLLVRLGAWRAGLGGSHDAGLCFVYRRTRSRVPAGRVLGTRSVGSSVSGGGAVFRHTVPPSQTLVGDRGSRWLGAGRRRRAVFCRLLRLAGPYLGPFTSLMSPAPPDVKLQTSYRPS